MAKTVKNIPLSTLAGRIAQIAKLGGSCDFRVFDLHPGWRPLPDDIQISVQRLRQPNPARNFLQFHQRFVLKFHLEGESVGYVDEKKLRFLPGEGILVFPFQLHRITSVPTPEGQLRVLANFTVPAGDRELLEPLRDRVFTLDGELLAALEKLVAASSQPGAAGEREAVSRLAAMLVDLREKILRGPCAASPREEPGTGVFECIRYRYRTGISVKELAAQLGVSEGRVYRKFLHETGKSPGRVIRELRLKKAAEMLRHTGEPIRKIGELCGFATPFSFSRAFRRRYGVSPRAFRNGESPTPPGEL